MQHARDCARLNSAKPCDCGLSGTPDKAEAEHHIVIDLYRREDGGLRIAGRGDARGLILSEREPQVALSKVWPALNAIKQAITK